MKPGDDVAWKWGNGLAESKVISVHDEPTVITTKGKQITRNGGKYNLAVVVKNVSGSKVLKLESELQKTK